MNFFTKEKLLFWGIIILVILNIVTLAALWLGRARPHKLGPPGYGFQPPTPPPSMHAPKTGPLPSMLPPQKTGPLPFMHEPRKGPPSPPHPMLAQELGMNQEQRDALEKLRDDHFEKVEAITKEVDKIKGELFDLLFEGKGDEKIVAEKIQMIGQKRSEVELLTFKHFNDILKLCEDEQKKKFREMLSMALKHGPTSLPGPPAGPPPGPPMGPPPGPPPTH